MAREPRRTSKDASPPAKPKPPRKKPGPKRKTGIPAGITEALTCEIEGYLREGNALATSARLANVNEGTFMVWMRMGRGPDAEEPYRSFRTRIVHAKAEVEREVVRRLLSTGEWKAMAHWLRLRNSQHWEPTKKTEARVTVSAEKLSDEELQRLVDEASGTKLPKVPK